MYGLTLKEIESLQSYLKTLPTDKAGIFKLLRLKRNELLGDGEYPRGFKLQEIFNYFQS
jgi:hypothetical protein